MVEISISVIQTLCLFVGVLLRYLPFRDVISNKQRKILFTAYIVVSLINTAIMLNICFFNKISQMTFQNFGVLTSIITTLINIIVIKKHVKEHLFTLGIVIIFNYLIMNIPTYIVQHTISFNTINGYLFFIIYNLIFSMGLLFPIKKMLDKTVKPFLVMEDNEYWNTIWFIPIALLTALLFMIPHTNHTETIEHLLGHAMLAVVLVLICLSIAKDYNGIKEKEDMTEHINKSKFYYSSLKTKMEEGRKKKHDLKHLLISIRHYIDTDDKTGLNDFCDEIEQVYFKEDILPYTGNASIDGIVYHYLQLSKVKNIDFKYTGSIKNRGIGDMDLCVLLGNALDNAFTACLTSNEQKSISLIAQSEENVLSIVIQNTFDGKMDVEKDVIFSRKRDKEQGVGLKSMKEICDKYQGTMETKWDESKFTLLIMLPINEE